MVDIRCPSCARRLRIRETLAGKNVKCPACESPLQVPNDTTGLSGDCSGAVDHWWRLTPEKAFPLTVAGCELLGILR